MGKIILICPPVLAVLEPWFDEPKFPRTALAHLAGYLRAKSDYHVQCIDSKFLKWSFEKTLNEVVKLAPDIIGITAFTNEIKPAAYLAGLIKKELPNAVIVCGGAHITSLPEQTMYEFPNFDIGVVGEGEVTFLELCNAIFSKAKLSTVSGIVFRDSGKIILNPTRNRIFNLDDLPMPAWDLFPPAEEYYIQTERGCPFACVFCLNHNGKVARKLSVNRTIEEMKWLINYGAKRISFGDELFSVDMNRAELLIDAIFENDLGHMVSWDIQTHVAFVNDNLFQKMKRANIEKCEMGVETGDEDILRKMGKATNVDLIVNSFRLAKKHQIKTGSFFIIGQPNETYKSIFKTIKLAIKINPDEPIFGTMVPYPGTEVAKMAAENKNGYRLITTDWDEYRKQLNGSLELENISRTRLEWLQIIGYVSVFIFNFRIMDLLKFFWSYRVGALNLLRKVVFSTKKTSDFITKPADYDQVINSPISIQYEEIIKARQYWSNYQKDEIIRTKREMPNLLVEQRPLN